MKSKSIPYLDQLLELGKLYKVDELKLYAKSKKKLHQSLDDANENFEKENGMVISKFETQLNAKKADILEDKEVLAYEISHDIIRKIL